MKTIIFKLQKGGTGATTIGVTVAVELAKAGKKTLLIDADPQGNATTWLDFDAINYELADILQNKVKPADAILKTKQENLFVIPTAGLDGELSKIKDPATIETPFIMADICESLSKNFDYCIIDLSPSFNSFERACYLASNEIIPVLLPDEFSLNGLEIFRNHLQETKKNWHVGAGVMESSKVILNELNNSKTIAKAIKSNFESSFNKDNLFIIPIEPSFEKSQVMKTFIQEIGAKENTLKEITRLANAIKGE